MAEDERQFLLTAAWLFMRHGRRERALSVFIQPPSVDELRRRLEGRATDAPEVINDRIARAEYELSFAPQFDTIVVNDDLETAKAEALQKIKDFLG